MGEQPSGTLTFLFTDIEGSTRRWQAHPAAMASALELHDALLADAVEGHGGRIFKNTGDGACAAFGSATGAVAAAVDFQRRLAEHDFAAVDGLRARVGLHTGDAEQRDGDYFGPALNRTARIMDVAHGGQIVLSAATASLLGDDRAQVAVRDLGEHVLRDIALPERIYQVVAPGLPVDFPPLRTAMATAVNLPQSRTRFVGRSDDVAELVDAVAAQPLTTLVGTGGTGKTRLAVEVADRAAAHFPGGVYFVDLSPLTDGQLIMSAIASGVGVVTSGPGVGSLDVAVTTALADRRCLVVLDNCEHLIEDCADVVDGLLEACSQLRVLATSREALDVDGEHVWPVPSLSLPAPGASVEDSEAVALFVDRARAADIQFRLTPENTEVVAEICRRLDGIPLAIELAASRVAHMAPSEVAARLDDRFRLLTGGRRRRAQRQQTLQAAMDWSHDLLSEDERALFRRLSVFAGHFTQIAVEEICGPGISTSVLDLMRSLVSKSLVVAEHATEETRFRLLETMRLYASERLVEAGEADRFRTAHRDWYLDLLRQYRLDELGISLSVLTTVSADVDNLRAALDWSESVGDTAAIVELVARLSGIWALMGNHDEGAVRITSLLPGIVEPADQAICLAVRSFVDMTRGEFDRMRADAHRSMELAPDGPLASLALNHAALHLVFEPSRYDEARRLMAQGQRAAMAQGLSLIVGMCEALGAQFDVVEGRYDAVIELARATPAAQTFADLTLRLSACTACFMAGAIDECLEQATLLMTSWPSTYAAVMAGVAELAAGHRERAEALIGWGVRQHLDLPAPLGTPDCLMGVAALALEDGDPERALMLLEAAFAIAGPASFRSPPAFVLWREHRHRARALLDRDAADRAKAQGRALNTTEALAAWLGDEVSATLSGQGAPLVPRRAGAMVVVTPVSPPGC